MTIVRRIRRYKLSDRIADHDTASVETGRLIGCGYHYAWLVDEAERFGYTVTLSSDLLALWEYPPPRVNTPAWRRAHRHVPVGRLIAETRAGIDDLDEAACRLRARATVDGLLPDAGVFTWDQVADALAELADG